LVCLLAALTVLAPLAMSFADQWGDIFEECNIDSFVDNTLNGCNDAHLEMAMLLPELIAKGQECVQIWEHIHSLCWHHLQCHLLTSGVIFLRNAILIHLLTTH
jgi:hypothetical protein